MKSRMTNRQNQRNQNNETTPQRIQERAYELYVNRGQEPGHELEDWLQAEREVNGSHEQKQAG